MTAETLTPSPPGDACVPLYQRRRVIVRSDENGGGASLARAAHVVTLECDDVRLLALTAEGLSPAVIGRRMGLNERTIRRRLSRLCERIDVSTPVQAVVWAVRHGVI